jgi:hypothetical protein
VKSVKLANWFFGDSVCISIQLIFYFISYSRFERVAFSISSHSTLAGFFRSPKKKFGMSHCFNRKKLEKRCFSGGVIRSPCR